MVENLLVFALANLLGALVAVMVKWMFGFADLRWTIVDMGMRDAAGTWIALSVWGVIGMLVLLWLL